MLRCVSQRLISPHFRAISSSLGLFISLCLFFVCKIQLVLNSFRWVPLVAKYHTMIMQLCSFLYRLYFVSEKNCVVFERFLQEPVQVADNYSQNLYDNFILLLLRINLLYTLCWHLQKKILIVLLLLYKVKYLHYWILVEYASEYPWIVKVVPIFPMATALLLFNTALWDSVWPINICFVFSCKVLLLVRWVASQKSRMKHLMQDGKLILKGELLSEH